MEITIKHFDGKWPSFDVMLHGTAGAEPFLTIKGCRIAQGSNGPFVSYPSRKDDRVPPPGEKQKYWPHVYGGVRFNEHILKLANVEQAPVRKPALAKAAPTYPATEEDSDIPY